MAPGQSHRKGISLVQAVQTYADEETVERLFTEARWPNGIACVKCGSTNIQTRPTRKPQSFRCRDCRKDFSIKTGTVMQGSNIALSKWALAAYLMTTNLKGVSSMKLSREPEHHAEISVASGTSHTPSMEFQRPPVLRAGRG